MLCYKQFRPPVAAPTQAARTIGPVPCRRPHRPAQPSSGRAGPANKDSPGFRSSARLAGTSSSATGWTAGAVRSRFCWDRNEPVNRNAAGYCCGVRVCRGGRCRQDSSGRCHYLTSPIFWDHPRWPLSLPHSKLPVVSARSECDTGSDRRGFIGGASATHISAAICDITRIWQ